MKVECIWYPLINIVVQFFFFLFILNHVSVKLNQLRDMVFVGAFLWHIQNRPMNHIPLFFVIVLIPHFLSYTRLSRRGLNGRNLIEFHDKMCAIFSSILNSKLFFAKYKFHCTRMYMRLLIKNKIILKNNSMSSEVWW